MRGRVPEVDRTVVERRDPLIGTRFDDRFRIDARLAAGGFGAIYRATDLHAQHEVALKILHPSLTTDPAIIARFRREGATLITLRDPHTVSAYELGEAPDGTLYIAMELLRGQTLHEVYTRHSGPLPWRRVAAIARAVCSSLAEAHDRGIIHRDLKPANIHLQQRTGNADFVKVLDFGIAKILRGSDLEASDLTQGGQMVGTFDYMAPEQMLGGEIGGRTDIYSLGVVMYEMVCGRLPYGNANSPTHLLAMLLTSVPARLTDRVPVPPALDDIVLRCLAREPHDRFAHVGELSDALGEVIARGGFHEDATVTSHVFPELPGGPSTDPGGPATELTGGPATEPGADDVTVLVRSDIRDALPEDTPLPQATPVVRRPPRPSSLPGVPPLLPPVTPPVVAPPVVAPPVVAPPPPLAGRPARRSKPPPFVEPDLRPTYPVLDRPRRAVSDLGAWQPAPPARPRPTTSQPARPRLDPGQDAALRRTAWVVIWVLVLLLGAVLGIAVSRLV